jgi:hypothetical protein
MSKRNKVNSEVIRWFCKKNEEDISLYSKVINCFKNIVDKVLWK